MKSGVTVAGSILRKLKHVTHMFHNGKRSNTNNAMNSLLFKLNMLLLHKTFEPHEHVNSKCKRRSPSPEALNPLGGEGSSPPR